MTEQLEGICPLCLGRRQVERIPVGSFGVPAGLTICLKCQGTGKAPKADPKLREKIASWLYNYTDWVDSEREIDDEGWLKDADQIIAMIDDVKKEEG